MADNKGPAASSAPVKRKYLSMKATFLIIVGCLAGVVLICSCVTALYASQYSSEGTLESTTDISSLLPSDDQAALDRMSSLFSSVGDDSEVYADLSAKPETDENSIVVNGSGSDELASAMKYISSSVVDKVKSYYPSHEGTFGDGFSDFPIMKLSASDCSDISASAEKGEDGKATGYYLINVSAKPSADTESPDNRINETFRMSEADSIREQFASAASDMFVIEDQRFEQSALNVTARVSAEGNKLDKVILVRAYNVTLRLKFIGDYADYGTQDVSFDYKVTETWQFTWAGISIDNTMQLTKGTEQNVDVAATVADDATASDYSITFSSSDDSVATVDKDGNVKAVSISPDPVYVTVTFNYLGHTYKDVCTVYVTVAAEKISVEPNKLDLKTGETYALSADVTPHDATRRGYSWFSQDSGVVTVDSSGNITAVGAGTAKVYAVSDDGGFLASCTVTVS